MCCPSLLYRFWSLAFQVKLQQIEALSENEEAILAEHYYFGRDFSYPLPSELSDEDIIQELCRSTDPNLDGEYAEAHMSRLVMMLSVAGDERFSRLLRTESADVRNSSIRYVNSMWNHHKLAYPMTQRMQHE